MAKCLLNTMIRCMQCPALCAIEMFQSQIAQVASLQSKRNPNEQKPIRQTSSVSDISKERSEKFMRSIPQHVGVKNDELFNELSKPYRMHVANVLAYFACTPSIQRKLMLTSIFAISNDLPEQKLCSCFRAIFHLFLDLNSSNEIQTILRSFKHSP